MTEPLPKTPNELPDNLRYNCDAEANYLRNAFVGTLKDFESVTIEFERDDECDCDEEPIGQWTVYVTTSSRKRFTANHATLINALWYVLQHAGASDRSDWEAWEQRRKDALGKLSADERRILGLQ